MKPLEGIKVVDLTRILAGPYCTQILADLGADVIKVERPETGDDARDFGPFVDNESAYFASVNRNKKSVVLNLKSKYGQDQLRKLVADADVLVENFRAGTMERFGFSWETLKEINPKLIYGRISGFGQTGPYKSKPAYDIIVQGLGGIMSITGQPGGPPTRVGASIGDITAALYAAIGILSALHMRTTTGEGQEIDISLLDCQVSILENAIARYMASGTSPEPIGNRHPSIAPFSTFKTKDDYLIIAVGNDSLWSQLCECLNSKSLAEDSRFDSNDKRNENWQDLELILNNHFAAKGIDEWLEILSASGIPCSRINNVEKIINDPQIMHRDILWDINLNSSAFKVVGLPLKFSGVPDIGVYLNPPELGQHSKEILDEDN